MRRSHLFRGATVVIVLLGLFGCKGERARLEKRTQEGDVQAMYELAGYLDVRSEVSYGDFQENREKAWDWYRRAAQQGHTKAMMKLGRGAMAEVSRTYGGELAKARRREAFSWFERAAKAGDFDGQIELYTIYLTGSWESWGIPKDPEQARYWEAKVEAGYREAGYDLAGAVMP